MSLPEVDIAFLDEQGIAHEIAVESGMTCIVIPDWPLPEGFDRPTADLLVRLTPGYPDVPPDMWWFDPPVLKADGQALPRTNAREHYLGAHLAALVAPFQWSAVEIGASIVWKATSL